MDDFYKTLQAEREKSDKLYAIKLVERILFSILGIVGVAVLVKLLMTINL